MTARADTTMAGAFARAGMNTTESRLRMIATDALAKHHGNAERALKTFEKEIDGDKGLIREALSFYLTRYRLRDDGQANHESQSPFAIGPQANGDGRGQPPGENQNWTSASSHRDGADPRGRENQPALVRPAREPSPQDRAAARAVSRQLASTVLDSFKIRDGRSIGDVRFGELERLRTSNAMEASVIRQIQKHSVADHDARVRDVVKPDDLSRMIQKAAEVADAA